MICKEFFTKFSLETVECACIGCKAFVNGRYHGNALDVAHVDKKTNAKCYLHEQKVCNTLDQIYLHIERRS